MQILKSVIFVCPLASLPVSATGQLIFAGPAQFGDRALNQTRRVVDHNTMIVNPSEVDTFIPTSAVMSPTLEGGSFGPTQSFSGQQLLNGIPLGFASAHRFFRLVN